MRTDEEVLKRIQDRSEADMFGWEIQDLTSTLPYELAKPYMRDGTTPEQWGEVIESRDRESVLARMLDYMPFAWEKANGGRGLSASRSMSHYTSWLWLLGDKLEGELENLLDYQFYGKDKLVAICEKYGWDHTQWDDGVREN